MGALEFTGGLLVPGTGIFELVGPEPILTKALGAAQIVVGNDMVHSG